MHQLATAFFVVRFWLSTLSWIQTCLTVDLLIIQSSVCAQLCSMMNAANFERHYWALFCQMRLPEVTIYQLLTSSPIFRDSLSGIISKTRNIVEVEMKYFIVIRPNN